MQLHGTFALHEFHEQNRPPYAILSHTWEQDEVLLADAQSKDVLQRAGYRKIKSTLEQAGKDGLSWVWIDTVCINKESNVELSEAINAMFNKYNVRARLPRWLKPPGTVMMKLRACGVFVVIESDFT